MEEKHLLDSNTTLNWDITRIMMQKKKGIDEINAMRSIFGEYHHLYPQ